MLSTRIQERVTGWLVWDLLAQEPNLAMLRQTYGESTAYGGAGYRRWGGILSVSRRTSCLKVVIICKVFAFKMLFQWTKQMKIAWSEVWLVSSTASTLQPRLSPKRFSSDDENEMMATFNKKSYCG
ncbi:hypothetical protein AVEN_65802-1 [Araneus ventricosus]|uniref:Uncharacterized protein n=1 Tax=Araneus ventricosus TaxID=182803 RepID=A0A4Y2SF93_ARAVE|nr:hypothetical protein AVEN_65802-1 [Araneus ventricosus]